MKLRPIALLALTLGASLAATSCSSMSRDAARVNGTTISVEQIEDAVDAYKELGLVTGEVPPTNSRIAQTLLGILVRSNAAGITTDERSAAEAQVADRLVEFPAVLRPFVVDETAVQARLAQDQPGLVEALNNAEIWVNPSMGTWNADDVNVVSLSEAALAGG